MSILLIIGIILIISAMSDFKSIRDDKIRELNNDIRHDEMMEQQKEFYGNVLDELDEIKQNSKRDKRYYAPSTTRTRRYLKDKNGNILAEEVLTTQGKFNDYSDSIDEDDEDDYFDE